MKQPRIAIIGSGMSGICMGATLKARGFTDFTLFEKADRPGGTWRDNTYPGVACDVPSAFYQFDFDQNPNWSHLMSPGHEIARYLDDVVERQGLTEHIRYGVTLTKAVFDGASWQLAAGEESLGAFDFLISATGILHHPKYPEIAGLADFAGPAFHSSRWDHTLDLTDKRVGLIGTGSTGAQIVAALGGNVEALTVFQRTPQWVLPMPNPEVSGIPRALASRIPGVAPTTKAISAFVLSLFIEGVTHDGWQRRVINRWVRASLLTVRDPELRAKLTPDFQPLCRRLIISSGYYSALQKPGVDVVTEGIERIESNGVRTADGAFHELDALVLATGFDAHAFIRPVELVGRDGVTLDDEWANGPRAYRTVAQPGFPNYFTLMGPHSPVGNFSLTTIAQTQAGYITEAIQRWSEDGFTTVEPCAEVTKTYNESIREAAKGTVWASGCQSWYLGPDGVPELWPWHPRKHQEMLKSVDWNEYLVS